MSDKKRKKAKILTVIGVTCIIWGFVVMFISSIKEDQRIMNSRMDTILKEYDKFSKKIEKFNTTRDTLHNEFLNKVYYESLEANDVEYKNKLYQYEKEVSKISQSTKKLREYCEDDLYYSSADVNSKCAAFKLGYEEMVNSFVEDINNYNNNLTEYNKWLDSEGRTESIRLDSYQTKKKYIDYNKDGEYSGKFVEEKKNDKVEDKKEEEPPKEESDKNE